MKQRKESLSVRALAVVLALSALVGLSAAPSYYYAVAVPTQVAAPDVGGQFTLEYSAIPNYVSANLDVIKTKNSLSSQAYDAKDYNTQISDALASYDSTSQEYADKIQAARDAYDANVAIGGSVTEADLNEQIETLQAARESALEKINSSIDTLKTARSTSEYSREKTSLTIVSTLQAQTNAAHRAFLNYYSLIEKKLSAENQLANAKRQLDLAKQKLNRQMISQDAYDKIADTIEPLQNQIDNYTTQLRKNELSLKTALGLSLSTSLTFGPLPSLEFSGIPALSRDADRKTYTDRSVSVQLAYAGVLKALRDRNEGISDAYYDQKDADISYEQALETATKDFEASYDDLQDAYKAYQNAEKTHENKEKELSKLKTKYKSGRASKNSVTNKEDEVYQSKHNLQAQAIDLFFQYQAYKNALTL